MTAPRDRTTTAPDPARARVLAGLVAAATVIGLLAMTDPSTLRPGSWTVLFVTLLATSGAVAAALLLVGHRWSDGVLGALVCGLMGLVLLSVLANQDRAAGILNVVLLLPGPVYAAVFLSHRVARATMVVLTAYLGLAMWALTSDLLRWVVLVSLPLLAFLGTTEVVLRLRAQLGRAAAALERQSMTDPLTGLLNRRALADRLAGRERPGASVRTVIALDVDHFKAVNDALGHAAGDELLRRIGAGLAAETRDEDVAVRLGGEEFLVLSATPAGRAADFAELLRSRAAHWMSEWSATVSVGAVTVLDPGTEGLTGARLEAAVQEADACLYAAKRRGRDRVVLVRWRTTDDVGAPI